MDPLNAFDVLTYARQFNDEELETACWEVIDYNTEAIVADDSFLDVKHESLISFVERSSLRVKETTLFKAMDRWAAKRCEEANLTVNGENKRAFMGDDLLKQFRFSLMSPDDFSNVVLPTEILLLTEAIDVFKQFTQVSIPEGFKFSISRRKTYLEPLHSERTGTVHETDKIISGVSGKSGLLTFAVKRDIKLSGVKIVTDKGQDSCRVSLSIAQRGKKMRQIKDKYFTCNEHNYPNYGEINVVFNRPFSLSKNTCYTIETDTDTTNNCDSAYVYRPTKPVLKHSSTQTSLTQTSSTQTFSTQTFSTQTFSTQTFSRGGFARGTTGYRNTPPSFSFAPAPIESSLAGTTEFTGFASPSTTASPIKTPSSDTADKDNIISCCCYGNCDKNCPEHSSAFVGEVLELVFKDTDKVCYFVLAPH